jgi:hypothetical protein
MDLAAIRTAIETWIGATCPSLTLFWHARPRTWAEEHAILRIAAPTTKGRDSLTYVYNAPPTDTVTPTAAGNREITVEVKVVSYDATDTEDALSYTQALVDSLRLPSNLATFEAAGLGYKEILNQIDLSEIADKRELSMAQIDVRFHADALVTGTQTGYVEQWGVESDTLDLPDGNPAPNQIDEIMP